MGGTVRTYQTPIAVASGSAAGVALVQMTAGGFVQRVTLEAPALDAGDTASVALGGPTSEMADADNATPNDGDVWVPADAVGGELDQGETHQTVLISEQRPNGYPIPARPFALGQNYNTEGVGWGFAARVETTTVQAAPRTFNLAVEVYHP